MSRKPIRRFPRLDYSKLTRAEQRDLLIDACRQETAKLRALKHFQNVNVLPLVAQLFDALLFLDTLRKEESP
jgi:hypothetical protein